MKTPEVPAAPDRDANLREIPKWADRYARHRVMLVLLSMVVFIAAFAVIWGLSVLASIAWRADHVPLATVLMVADLAFCAWWVWLCLSRRRQIALTERANRWLYRNEGEAAVAAQPLTSEGLPWVMQPTRLANSNAAGSGFTAP